MVSCNNFKSQKKQIERLKSKSKYVAYVPVLSQISNCQGLGRKRKHTILKNDRILYIYIYIYIYIYVSREGERGSFCCTRFGAESVAKNSGPSCRKNKEGGISGRKRPRHRGGAIRPDGRCAQKENGKGGRVSRAAVGTGYRHRRGRGSQEAVEKSTPLGCGGSRVTAESPRLPRCRAPRRGWREGRLISKIVSVRRGGA